MSLFADNEFANEQYIDRSLSHVDFSQSEFVGCEFHSCDLRRSDWLGAIIESCDFISCDFSKAFLTGVRFENCSFDGCNFDEAYIFRTQFKDCEIACCSMNDTMLSTVDFPGTYIQNIRWKGTCINSAPLIVEGIEYPVVALDNGYMHVGCEFNTMQWFYDTDEKHSARMEGLRARRFWKKNKKWIFDMLIARGLYEV